MTRRQGKTYAVPTLGTGRSKPFSLIHHLDWRERPLSREQAPAEREGRSAGVNIRGVSRRARSLFFTASERVPNRNVRRKVVPLSSGHPEIVSLGESLFSVVYGGGA